jgi:chitinase
MALLGIISPGNDNYRIILHVLWLKHKYSTPSGVYVNSHRYPGYSEPGYSEVGNCLLNVCCSQYGFCGLTEEFCGNKTATWPSCGSSGSIERVIGYYEGWATRRNCDLFTPEQIPKGVYTHINFAFASIDPVTFAVVPANQGDVDEYTRLIALKDHQPGLKVFFAIGGWPFNGPDLQVIPIL